MESRRAKPGQESVWDYPRPPRIEPENRKVRIVLAGTTIAVTERALRVLETSHPPGIYLPQDAFAEGTVVPHSRRTVCEWKGIAQYWDLWAGDTVAPAAGWSYAAPHPGFESISGFISVYPSRVDACFLDDEMVVAQDGGFYGGWITREIIGPFKGAAGTRGW